MLTAADKLRILVATDNHVGYGERDAIRGEDSWRTFDEIMILAKDRDVDMVLLAGDLFHDNNPSRKALTKVMESIVTNCFGDKPCELEYLSDPTEAFPAPFNRVNYENPDINVSIPVFSINGNHDDPSGDGHLAALDVLQRPGLVNYYGRTPESDSINVKPVLLQKGQTKVALYGLSNVRDERLFRTFRDGKVKFYQPGVQKSDWFNVMSVHQNHHAYTETGYLPENFLPDFMDLVVWGHEHECLIDPRYNPEMNFHVMQPGSSVATSLMPGEAVPKHVAILNISGRTLEVEKIRLKTVRPFVMREIVLSEHKEARKIAKKEGNRPELTRILISIVEELIDQARSEWLEAQDDGVEHESAYIPLPLIRLRVEYSSPDGGHFDCENPQRFSNRFVGRVANTNDVVQFHRKKTASARKTQNGAELPEESIMAQLSLDTVKVEKLVREFLTAQSLTILPQNSFGDAVSQFVDKDDKHAMEMFVADSLKTQVKHLIDLDAEADEDLHGALEMHKSKLEELFAAGHLKNRKAARLKPKPENWDTDLDGNWSDQPGALEHSDLDDDDENEEGASVAPAPKGRGRAAPKKAAAVKKAPVKSVRGRKKVVDEESEDNDDEGLEAMIIDDDDEAEEDDEHNSPLFVKPAAPTRTGRKPATAKVPPKKAPAKARATPARAATSTRQSKINFSQSQAGSVKAATGAKARSVSIISDDIDDDDGGGEDAFEPAPTQRSTRARR